MRSNLYVVSFMAGITIVLGFMLSIAATSLKAKQEFNVEIDIKKNILRSLSIPEDQSVKLTQTDIQKLFDEEITTLTIDKSGEANTDGTLDIFVAATDGQATGYALPISGKGLWSTIYGYLALEPDGETIKGVTFYKHGETPGLGGELEKEWFTSNYIGKKIYNPEGNLVCVQIVKGVVNSSSADAFHQVDGISGATLTTKGMNQFITEDIKIYEPFLDKVRAGVVTLQ